MYLTYCLPVPSAAAPHYDRPYREFDTSIAKEFVARFSAYSVVVYLSDDCEGGCTNFLMEEAGKSKRSKSGLTRVKEDHESAELEDAPLSSCASAPAESRLLSDIAGTDSLDLQAQRKRQATTGHTVVARVVPRAGDVLVFPHGRANGCHPDPLHEGAEVTRGTKTIIRTDVMFRSVPPRSRPRKQPAGVGVSSRDASTPK